MAGPCCKTLLDAHFILGEVRNCMGPGLKGIVSGDQVAVTHTPFMLQDKAAAAAMLSDH